jgi:hypothetical protein
LARPAKLPRANQDRLAFVNAEQRGVVGMKLHQIVRVQLEIVRAVGHGARVEVVQLAPGDQHVGPFRRRQLLTRAILDRVKGCARPG